MKPILIRISSLTLILIMGVGLTGCPKSGPVLSTIDEMERISRKRGENDRAEIRKSVVATFEIAQQSAEDRVCLKLEEMKIYLYRTTERRIEQVAKRVSREIELALEDVLGRLKDEVRSARAATTDPDARSKELEAATALSATIVYLETEKAKLVEGVRAKFTAERDRQIMNLEAQREGYKEQVAIDAEAQADALLDNYMVSSEELDEEMELGFESIRRYINAPSSAITNFSKGLLGEKFGSFVAEKANELADKGVAEVSSKIESAARASAEKISAAEDAS